MYSTVRANLLQYYPMIAILTVKGKFHLFYKAVNSGRARTIVTIYSSVDKIQVNVNNIYCQRFVYIFARLLL